MTYKILILAALMAFPMLSPSTAEAKSKCKTYSKTMYINGYKQTGYAEACRSRGEWEITRLSGPRAVRAALAKKINHDLYGGRAKIIVLDHNDNYNNRHYRKKSRGYGNRHGYNYDRVRYDYNRHYDGYDFFRVLGQKVGGYDSRYDNHRYRKHY